MAARLALCLSTWKKGAGFYKRWSGSKNNTPCALRWQRDHGDKHCFTFGPSFSRRIPLLFWRAGIPPWALKPEGCQYFSSSHQGPEVRQVDVAVFVHLHHLHLHAGHLSTRWVGAVRRLGDQTHLGGKWKICRKDHPLRENYGETGLQVDPLTRLMQEKCSKRLLRGILRI